MVGEKDVAIAYTNTGPIWSYLVTNINGSLLATIADFLLVRILIIYPWAVIIFLLIISADMEVLSLVEQLGPCDPGTVDLATYRDR